MEKPTLVDLRTGNKFKLGEIENTVTYKDGNKEPCIIFIFKYGYELSIPLGNANESESKKLQEYLDGLILSSHGSSEMINEEKYKTIFKGAKSIEFLPDISASQIARERK